MFVRWQTWVALTVSFVGMLIFLQISEPDQNQKSPGKSLYQWIFSKNRFKNHSLIDTIQSMPIRLSSTNWENSPVSAHVLKNDQGILIPFSENLVGGQGNNSPSNQATISSPFTIITSFRVDQEGFWNGILLTGEKDLQRNQDAILSLASGIFSFRLSHWNQIKTTKTVTEIRSNSIYTPGTWVELAVTFDGIRMHLYLNGEEEAVSDPIGQLIQLPWQTMIRLASFKGAIHELLIASEAWNEASIKNHYLDDLGKTDQKIDRAATDFYFVIQPYLQFPTQNEITVMWETSQIGTSLIEYGTDDKHLSQLKKEDKVALHEVTIPNLQPESKYIYRVQSVNENGKQIQSDWRQMMTAVRNDSPFTFAVIGDTQRNPRMTGIIAKLIYARRPHFLVHCGDVVDDGPDKNQWINDLFRPSAELLSRVPVFPTIGNHEKNHAYYYRYFALPKPEYYYQYHYGNADFFVIDTNKKVDSASEQFRWLDDALGRSKAKWKFVYHHHPCFSSDDDDYGNTWKGYNSQMGDKNARNLVKLYEKHHVDIAWNGHIHMYERSWPLRNGKVDHDQGTIYITSGGGGATLENFAPLPNWFKAQGRVDYHFCYVTIHQNRLEFKAFDQNGILFDTMNLRKE